METDDTITSDSPATAKGLTTSAKGGLVEGKQLRANSTHLWDVCAGGVSEREGGAFATGVQAPCGRDESHGTVSTVHASYVSDG